MKYLNQKFSMATSDGIVTQAEWDRIFNQCDSKISDELVRDSEDKNEETS